MERGGRGGGGGGGGGGGEGGDTEGTEEGGTEGFWIAVFIWIVVVQGFSWSSVFRCGGKIWFGGTARKVRYNAGGKRNRNDQ